MLTLAEHDKQIEQKREAMRTRERITTERDNAAARLATIQGGLAKPDPAIAALEGMLALVGDVPSGILTRGNALMPGGQDAQFVLRKVAADALIEVAAKRRKLEESLPVAKARLLAADEALARFN